MSILRFLAIQQLSKLARKEFAARTEATWLAMLEFRNAKPVVYEHDAFVSLLKAAEARITRSA